jgi:hypothetical protein
MLRFVMIFSVVLALDVYIPMCQSLCHKFPPLICMF